MKMLPLAIIASVTAACAAAEAPKESAALLQQVTDQWPEFDDVPSYEESPPADGSDDIDPITVDDELAVQNATFDLVGDTFPETSCVNSNNSWFGCGWTDISHGRWHCWIQSPTVTYECTGIRIGHHIVINCFLHDAQRC